jgi:hypothetical protein
MIYTDAQQKLLRHLKPGVDVPISTLYGALTGREPHANPRNMQHYVGAYVKRLNAKFEREGVTGRIVPGDVKRTYRLTGA